MSNNKIEVVSGDVKDLNISPIYDNIEVEKPKKKKKQGEIIIPEEKNKNKS